MLLNFNFAGSIVTLVMHQHHQNVPTLHTHTQLCQVMFFWTPLPRCFLRSINSRSKGVEAHSEGQPSKASLHLACHWAINIAGKKKQQHLMWWQSKCIGCPPSARHWTAFFRLFSSHKVFIISPLHIILLVQNSNIHRLK